MVAISQTAGEIFASGMGAIGGGKAGAILGTAVFPGAGTVAGGIVGAVTGGTVVGLAYSEAIKIHRDKCKLIKEFHINDILAMTQEYTDFHLGVVKSNDRNEGFLDQEAACLAQETAWVDCLI
jgi:outer membrane lipoprotein SlyB